VLEWLSFLVVQIITEPHQKWWIMNRPDMSTRLAISWLMSSCAVAEPHGTGRFEGSARSLIV
jgi:hypothetical protein